MDIQQLSSNTLSAASKAYAPYSNFKVGCVLVAADGQQIQGCNVENASYGLTICAERTAMVKAVSQSITNITKAYVYAATEDFCWPCGACRQFLNEFNPEMEVISINKDKKTSVTTLSALLPHSFGPKTLQSHQ